MTLSNKTILVLAGIATLIVAATMIAATISSHDQPGTRGPSDAFNRADLMFMNMMIIHHDQAITMAELAPNRTENENILALAENISEAQRRENEQMSAWLQSQGYERPTDGHRMAGRASPKEMALLEQSTGKEFDKQFAELMIEHHDGGIQMAQAEVQRGSHDELVSLADDMVRVQQREVDLMQRWLSDWDSQQRT